MDLGKKESSEAGMRRRERIRSLEGGGAVEVGFEEDGMTKEVGIGERNGGGEEAGKEEEGV